MAEHGQAWQKQLVHLSVCPESLIAIVPSSYPAVRDSSQRIPIAPDELSLVVWPLVQRPLGSLAAIGIAAAATWMVYWSQGEPWLAAVAGGALAVTLWRTWLPVTFELGPEGITQRVLGVRRRISWSSIGNVERLADGVLLVPDLYMTRLSALRGLYLPWLDKRPQVLALLEHYLPGR